MWIDIIDKSGYFFCILKCVTNIKLKLVVFKGKEGKFTKFEDFNFWFFMRVGES